MIKFSSDSNAQTDRLLAVENAKLFAALDHKMKTMSNYFFTEMDEKVLGCLA